MTTGDVDGTAQLGPDEDWPTWLPKPPEWILNVLVFGLMAPIGVAFIIGVSDDYTVGRDVPAISFEEIMNGLGRDNPPEYGDQVVNAVAALSFRVFATTIAVSVTYVGVAFLASKLRGYLVRFVRDIIRDARSEGDAER